MHENQRKAQLDSWFDELIRALDNRSVFINQSDDPVFFLVYPPLWSVTVYSMLPEWGAKLRHRSWMPEEYNVGLAVLDYLRDHPDRSTVVEFERENPQEISDVNRSLDEFLLSDGGYVVEQWVLDRIESLSGTPNGLLILSGIELLHPHLQIGRVEQRLQGRFRVPTIVLYPGMRTGSFGLRFLGFYPPDGTYRSRHIGGTRA